jgi:hypothetical protein
VALERDDMGKSANTAILVLPRRRRDTRDTVLWRYLALVDILLAQVARVLMPLE